MVPELTGEYAWHDPTKQVGRRTSDVNHLQAQLTGIGEKLLVYDGLRPILADAGNTPITVSELCDSSELGHAVPQRVARIGW